MTAPAPVWLITGPLLRPDLPLAIPTLAWIADAAGAVPDSLLDAPAMNAGGLFAPSGSTILGGHHAQRLAWLCNCTTVRPIVIEPGGPHDTALAAFGCTPIAAGDDLLDLYAAALAEAGTAPEVLLVAPDAAVGPQDTRAYLFPEIWHRRALAVPTARLAEAQTRWPGLPLLDHRDLAVDAQTVSEGIARAWIGTSRGVAFGDAAMMVAQMADHCHHRRVGVWAPQTHLTSTQTTFSYYTDASSPAIATAAALAQACGNRVIWGRQTCDGDIRVLSRAGCVMQITDPNRPCLPSVAGLATAWSGHGDEAEEPDDAQLRAWCDHQRRLVCLLWHSGEVAHDEAMLNAIELAMHRGICMGLGVHAQRYEHCPQLWELIAVPRRRGGARGLVEPLLHAGGLGVASESEMPAADLTSHLRQALARIRAIAGAAGTPTGHVAFLDTAGPDFRVRRPDVWQAITDAGLDHVVSSCRPGRNRVLWRQGARIVLNQSPTTIHGSSPFVRISSSDEWVAANAVFPGWGLAVLDAPVMANQPEIWRHGQRMARLVDSVLNGWQSVSATPRTIARYAQLLHDRGLIPLEETP